MNLFPCRQVLVVVFAFIVYSRIHIATCTTTQPPNSDATVTTAAVIPAATTIPTATPTPIPSNTDLAFCLCDLTSNACDVNCCCDADCSNDDRLAFRECLPVSKSVDDRLCLRSEIILFDNSPYVSNFTSDNLFCLYMDNNVARNYHSVPDLVTTEEVFNTYVKDYADFSFQPPHVERPTYSDFYKSGDKVYVIYDSRSQGVLGLPSSLASTYCTDGNPTAYLLNEENECVRFINNLATQCSSLPSLSSSIYYKGFRVVTSPALFQKYVPTNETNSTTTVDLESVTDLYNNSYTIPVELGTVRCLDTTGLTTACSISDPVYNAVDQTCENTVLQTGYTIQHDGTNGITNVTVDFLLGIISAGTNLHSQSFFTKFNGINDGEKFKRSGNPGYALREPVMSGILNNTIDNDGNVKQEIILNSNRDEWLTIKSSSATGDCSSTIDRRQSVQFGEDVRSGCFLQITLTGVTDYCELLQQRIVNALEGDQAPIYNVVTGIYSTGNRHVATFGNSDPQKVGDWVSIQDKSRPTPGPAIGQRCSLSLGMSIQILYAKVGSLSNPQSKILGVSFDYNSPEDVYFRCIGPYCQPGLEHLSQPLEIISSVTFIDVSQPAVGFQAAQPLFLAKVPYDFFYPFLTGTSSSVQHTYSSILIIFIFISALCYL